MNPMLACPDCGTQNRPDADLCAQCWRELSAGAVARIPVVAFAATAPSPAAPPPPAAYAAPVRRVAPAPAPEPVKPREAEAGPVPYFAPVGATGTGSVGFPLPTTPSTTTTTTSGSAPWGRLIALAMLVALLGGGYYFFFGKSSGAFSPSDGAYSIELPDGWERSEQQEASRDDIDFAVHPAGDELTMVAAGHGKMPPGSGTGQVRQVMAVIQQFMPNVPGLTMGPVQESAIVSGEGVSAYEMTLNASGGMLPSGGKMRFVAVMHEPSSNVVFMMVACVADKCSTAEPAFQTMAATLKFSG